MLQTFKAMSLHLKALGHDVAPNTIRNWQYKEPKLAYRPKRRGNICWDTVADFERYFHTVIVN